MLYFRSPYAPPNTYESDYVESMPMELRRRTDVDVLARAEGDIGNANLPLFAKYQFFTPGKLTRDPKSTVTAC